jgi:hypothetical protein
MMKIWIEKNGAARKKDPFLNCLYLGKGIPPAQMSLTHPPLHSILTIPKREFLSMKRHGRF